MDNMNNILQMDYSKIMQIPVYVSHPHEDGFLVTISEGQFKGTQINFINGEFNDENINYKPLFINNYNSENHDILIHIAGNILLKELSCH
jgi:hypothetical protein